MGQRAEQDLALIRWLMEESRREVVDRGKHFMIWGLVTTAGLAGTYAALAGWWAVAPRWTWTVLVVAGWVASFGVGLRDGRGARVRTLGRRVLGGIWLSTGVTLTLLGVAGLFGGVVPQPALPGVMSAVMGGAVLSTSVLMGDRWLGWVGAGWWVGALWMLFVPGVHTIPVMALMAVGLMVVPGAVLNARSRRPPVPAASPAVPAADEEA
jgi:hypothetical protein